MSATRSDRSPVVARAAATAAAASLLLLAGCGSGQVGTIGAQVAAVNGAQGEAGPLSVRNVTMAFPTSGSSWAVGSDVPLLFTITNSDVASDELTSVTSSAGSVQLVGNADIAGQSSLVSVAQEDADGVTETPTAPFSETPGELRAAITDTTSPIQPGLNVQVTFTFAKAGSVTVPVPLAYPETEREG